MQKHNSENSVRLQTYDPNWPRLFVSEKDRIVKKLPNVYIEHIGSTSIPGLLAKPIIDMLVGTSSEDLRPAAEKELTNLGYVKEGEREGHSWLAWPSPEERKYIVHLVVAEGDEWNRRLAFRNALWADPQKVEEYKKLKTDLAAQYREDLNGYTKAKAEFVKNVIASTTKRSTAS